MRLRLVHDLEDDGGEHVEPLAVPDRLVPARVGQENALQHQLWRGQLGPDTVLLLIPQYDGFPESQKTNLFTVFLWITVKIGCSDFFYLLFIKNVILFIRENCG